MRSGGRARPCTRSTHRWKRDSPTSPAAARAPNSTYVADSCVCRADKLARKIEKKPILKHVREVVALWEEMQPRKSTPDAKKALAVKITQAGKGHLKELSANHASSRAVQAALKHGGAPARAAVWAEVKDGALELAMSPHGSFVLRKIIALGDKAHLSGAARPHVLARHS